MARKKRDLPEINAGSMADIAFLLLIFFLVTTTMEVDTGIFRKLPPIVDTPIDDDIVSNKRNVLNIVINQHNNLLVKEESLELNKVKAKTIEFLTSKKPNMAVSTEKAVVTLKNHRLTDYKTYVSVQDQLTAAYMKVRNDASNAKFGKPFEDLTKEQSKEIKKEIPMAILEVEPIKEN